MTMTERKRDAFRSLVRVFRMKKEIQIIKKSRRILRSARRKETLLRIKSKRELLAIDPMTDEQNRSFTYVELAVAKTNRC